MQNRLIILLTGNHGRFSTNLLYRKYNLFKVSDSHIYVMCFWYNLQVLYYGICFRLLQLIALECACNNKNDDINTRYLNLFVKTWHNTQHRKLLLNILLSNLAKIPSVIKSCKSLGSFQQKLKRTLIYQYYSLCFSSQVSLSVISMFFSLFRLFILLFPLFLLK